MIAIDYIVRTITIDSIVIRLTAAVSALKKHMVPIALVAILICGLITAERLHHYRPEVVAARESAKRKAALAAENAKLKSESEEMLARLAQRNNPDAPPATRSVAMVEGNAVCVPDDDAWLRSWQGAASARGRASDRAVRTP